MSKFKPQMLRLIYIDREIRSGTRTGNYPNCRTLAEGWEVSRKTILRDIDYLKYQLGAPIEYDDRNYGYCYTEADYHLPAIHISGSELFAVCVAQKVLAQYENTPLYDKLAVVFDKLQSSMPDKVTVNPAWLDDRFSFFPTPAPKIDAQTWEIAFDGLRQERRLEFDYLIPGYSRKYRRTVDPYHALSHQSQWYLVGKCHYVNAVRVFALSRMSDVKLLEDHFFVPTEFDFQKLAGKHFGVMFGQEEHTVKVLFTKEAAPYAIEREWADGQKAVQHKDGTATLSFPTNHLFEVSRFVLSWGAGAQVLAPPELVDMVKKELAEGLGRYQ